jgi:hypothetical protein
MPHPTTTNFNDPDRDVRSAALRTGKTIIQWLFLGAAAVLLLIACSPQVPSTPEAVQPQPSGLKFIEFFSPF